MAPSSTNGGAPPSRGEPSTSRNSGQNQQEERRPSGASGKTEKDREREREREKEKEKDDPKHVGPWRIGKTIGKGSSGKSPIFNS